MTNKEINDSIENKQVFTTGEAAKICNVSQQTIIRCFDSGRLQGFKIPGSRFRRIPKAELIRFMHQNSMDLDRIATGPIQVVVVGMQSQDVDHVIQQHAAGHKIQIHHAEDAWQAGYLTAKVKPGLVLVSSAITGLSAISASKMYSESEQHNIPLVVNVDKYSNRLNVPSQFDDSNDAIKQAVQKLLSA